MKKLTAIIGLPSLLLAMACGVGCSSVEVQTNKSQVDAIIKKYLPPITEVEILSLYELQKRHGQNIEGKTTCPSWEIRLGCKIESIENPIVLLHEICHVIEGKWHGDRVQSGLEGCKSFNYDTLNNL